MGKPQETSSRIACTPGFLLNIISQTHYCYTKLLSNLMVKSKKNWTLNHFVTRAFIVKSWQANSCICFGCSADFLVCHVQCSMLLQF